MISIVDPESLKYVLRPTVYGVRRGDSREQPSAGDARGDAPMKAEASVGGAFRDDASVTGHSTRTVETG